MNLAAAAAGLFRYIVLYVKRKKLYFPLYIVWYDATWRNNKCQMLCRGEVLADVGLLLVQRLEHR